MPNAHPRAGQFRGLLITGVLASLGAGYALGLADTVQTWAATGLVHRGSNRLLLFHSLAFALLFLPFGLAASAAVWAAIKTPFAGRYAAGRSGSVITALTVAGGTALLLLVFAFRVWLDENTRLKTPKGAAIAAGLLLGSLVLGAVAGWLVQASAARLGRLARPALLGGLAALTVLGILALAVLRPAPPFGKYAGAQPDRGVNTIVLVVDTLRSDAVSSYDGVVETPAIDRLAADGVLYENAYTTAPWTRPSMASLWTGLYPAMHQARLGRTPLPDGTVVIDVLTQKVLTLAEHLAGRNTLTAGINSNPTIVADQGFAQGFDVYHTFPRPAFADSILCRFLSATRRKAYTLGYYEPGDRVTALARQWIDAAPPEPFFLYVHYMDPHEPYWEKPGAAWSRSTERWRREQKDISWDYYCRDVRFSDREVGRFLDHLRKRGLYDESLIVLVSDHGEEFFEHGSSGHGDNLTREQTRIPLIIKWPGNRYAGTRVRELVSLIDVAPTVLHALGNGYDAAMKGQALKPRPDREVPVFCEMGDETFGLRSIITPEWRYITRNGMEGTSSTVPDVALFNRAEDPWDRTDLAGRHPDIVSLLDQSMQAHFAEAELESFPKESTNVDVKYINRIRAIGYMGK